jgi:hypothetical protein
MRPLRPGEATLLSWRGGAVECRVVAAAGSYVLLRPTRITLAPVGSCTLSTLHGDPAAWDGDVELAPHPHELRFRVADATRPPDRRSSVRVSVHADAEVAGPGGAIDQVELLDISAGGMRFRRSGHLSEGTPVRVHARLPGGPVIEADAVVRVSDPDACGVAFTELRGATAADIGAWTVEVLRAAL